MPMPSLFKYFAFVGATLLGVLSLANFLLDPSTGATQVAAVPAKRQIVVQHDPRASKIERWRDDQAALKAAEQTQTTASAVAKSAPEPQQASALVMQTPAAKPAQSAPAAKPAQPAQATQPAQPAAPAQVAVAPAPQPASESAAAPNNPIVGTETTDEAAAKAEKAERKAKVAKAKARKERIARERGYNDAYGNRDTPRERYASSQQDQYYYGQRAQQQQGFTTRYSSAYAPQPSFGPFGWGRGW